MRVLVNKKNGVEIKVKEADYKKMEKNGTLSRFTEKEPKPSKEVKEQVTKNEKK